jgi:hypothetical protein
MNVVTEIKEIEAQALANYFETLAILVKDLEYFLIESNTIFSKNKIIKIKVDWKIKLFVHFF